MATVVNSFYIRTITILLLILTGTVAVAQQGIGSMIRDNSTTTVEVGTATLIFAERLFFGPNSDWEIHGTLEVWSRYIWIAPTARLHGTGKLVIHGPGDNIYYDGWKDSPTYLDGNDGNPLEVTVELRNPHQLQLMDLEAPIYSDPTFEAASPSAAWNLADRLDLAVDGAHIALNGYDLRLGANSTIENYGPKRHILTGNSIDGHLVKMFSGPEPFVFPVGITGDDYTPATLLPADKSVLAVSVQDYAAAGANVADAKEGMDRMWHIVSNQGVRAIYTLQHNTITNGSTYVDADAEIVQYAGGSNWIGGATKQLAEGIHERESLAVARDPTHPESWLTKLAYADGPEAVDDHVSVESGSRVDILVLENDIVGTNAIVVGKLRITRPPGQGVIYINADGSVTYTPNNGFVGTDAFSYEIEDEKGMTSEATITVTVTPRPLRIPNVFTPNNDGQNDVFEIEGIEGIDRIELVVMNRWGNEVYRSNEYKNNWNGGNLSEGTYFYEVIAYKGSERKRYSGWVLIKRI